MYLLWLVLLVVLLAFSIRPAPYLEGMEGKGRKAIYSSKTPEGTYAGYDANVKSTTTPNHNAYVTSSPQGTYGNFKPENINDRLPSEKVYAAETTNIFGVKGDNAAAVIGPNRSAYKVETENGTYSGFNGPNVSATVTPDGYSVTGPNRTFYGSCASTRYGCCPNSKDPKTDENGSNCSPYPPPTPSPPPPQPTPNYGYCSDGTTSKIDFNGTNCPAPAPAPTSCAASSYGCCPDQLTAKVDSNGSNCAAVPPSCAGSTFGCCPDGLTSKLDYNGNNCVPPPTPAPAPAPTPAPTSCTGSSYGCCPDQLTSKVDANGSNCASYPSDTMINIQPIRPPDLDAYNTSTVFLSGPTKKELTCPEPQPCPPCARCPEPSFDCKKVPNYSSSNSGHLPVPILNDFSQFGM